MIVGGTITKPQILRRKARSYYIFAARAIHELRPYILSQPLNDKRAYVITASYQAPEASLTLYVTHTVSPNNPALPVQYHAVMCS